MSEAEAAIAEIECYEYENDNGLTVWLRKNIERMNFVQIIEKLSEDLTKFEKLE